MNNINNIFFKKMVKMANSVMYILKKEKETLAIQETNVPNRLLKRFGKQ